MPWQRAPSSLGGMVDTALTSRVASAPYRWVTPDIGTMPANEPPPCTEEVGLASRTADETAVASHETAVASDQSAVAADHVGPAAAAIAGDVGLRRHFVVEQQLTQPADRNVDPHDNVQLVHRPHADAAHEVLVFELDAEDVHVVLWRQARADVEALAEHTQHRRIGNLVVVAQIAEAIDAREPRDAVLRLRIITRIIVRAARRTQGAKPPGQSVDLLLQRNGIIARVRRRGRCGGRGRSSRSGRGQ